jgi:hypothetical protein
MLIYEFSPFNYTLVFYKNVETLFTDRVRNVVITNSPDKDMIVADHMNKVNLRTLLYLLYVVQRTRNEQSVVN